MDLWELDQPLAPCAPQLLNRVPAHDPGQPRALLPAACLPVAKITSS
jgi:hypothetical protein